MNSIYHKILTVVIIFIYFTNGKKSKDADKPDWAKKDIRDYSDADLERLLDQWEEDEEPLPADELPEGHPDRPQPPIDFSKLDMNNPEELMKATKKGKTVMLFAKINKFRSRQETEEVSSLWQTAMYNAHIQGERFMIEDNRVMFMFRDGGHAWEAKDYLIEQDRVEDVQLEQKTYKGRYAEFPDADNSQKPEEKKKKKKKKKEKEVRGTASVEKVEL